MTRRPSTSTWRKTEQMPAFCIAFPVKPGKGPAIREFCEEVTGDRRREFEASEARLGIPREAWFLQATPQGDPFDQWFKEEVKAYTGVDLNQPPAGPLPERVLGFGYEG